jgi:hypothetical protein
VAILTRCRLGNQRLLFLLFAWLTLLPVTGPFPQIAHFFDIIKTPFTNRTSGHLKNHRTETALISPVCPLFKEENVYTFSPCLTSVLFFFLAVA